jgi:iron(III) transport system substrate-binding protein
MLRKIILIALGSLSLLLLYGCKTSDIMDNESGETGQLVIYSNRNERFVKDLIDQFTEETGIQVVALHGANAMQLIEERNNVQADIFISNDLGALGYLHQQGILQGIQVKGIENILPDFKAEDNAYFALSARVRGFIYNKDLIKENEMPTSIEDLFDAKWAEVPGGYAITRGGNSGMIGHVSALRYAWGDDKTAEWIKAIRTHASGIYQGHGEIRRAVGAGEHTFGLVNNYYYHQQLLETENNNVGFIYLDQGQDEIGIIANAAGLGLVKNGKNPVSSELFLEWIVEPVNQALFVGESLELLIHGHDDVLYPKEVAEVIVPFSSLKVQDMPMKALGDYFEDTKTLIESSGLDLDLK